MANIVIRVTDFSRDGVDAEKYDLFGTVICDEGSGAPIEWSAEGVLFRANVHVVHQAVLDAAGAALFAAEMIEVTETSRVRIVGGIF